MGTLINGDDGLPAEEVGAWAKEKHDRLRKYLILSCGARNKFLNGRSKSAAFVDLFCGPGRARVRKTGEWIEGSAVAAWTISREFRAPFSEIYVADIDDGRRNWLLLVAEHDLAHKFWKVTTDNGQGSFPF